MAHPAFNPELVSPEEQILLSNEEKQQPIVVQPLNQQQIIIVQPNDQQSAVNNNTHQPTNDELAEGIPQLPVLVSTPNEPTQVHSPSDGVGVAEGCLQGSHILVWIFTLVLWYVIASGIICAIIGTEDGYCGIFGDIPIFFGIFGAVFVIYLIECGCSSTQRYLTNILQKEGAAQFIERVKRQPAEIWWSVSCYHWERRTRRRTVTDSNGNKRTEWETYREKRYTWRAREQFHYGTCIDVSGDIIGLDEYKLTKLQLNKTFGFLNQESQQDYSTKLRMFRSFNWRDVHQEFHEDFSIPGYVSRILAESEPGVKPGWMSIGMFWLCNLIGLSPCFRTAMASKCGGVEYTFVKQLSATRINIVHVSS